VSVIVSNERTTAGQRGRTIVLDRVAAAIEWVTPVIRWLIGPLLVLLGAGLVATAVIGHAVWGELVPLDLDDWFVLGLLVTALLLPAVLLFLFWLALTAVRELPGKLRQFPEAVVEHRSTLAEIARQTRSRPVSPLGWFRSLGRMAKLLYRAQDDLIVYAPLLELLNPLLLIGATLAVPAVIIESLLAAAILASRIG
jgi:hypothetical protein